MRTKVGVQLLKYGSSNCDFDPVDLFHDKRPERTVKLIDLAYFVERSARLKLPVPMQETCRCALHERQGVATEPEIAYSAQEAFSLGIVRHCQTLAFET